MSPVPESQANGPPDESPSRTTTATEATPPSDSPRVNGDSTADESVPGGTTQHVDKGDPAAEALSAMKLTDATQPATPDAGLRASDASAPAQPSSSEPTPAASGFFGSIFDSMNSTITDLSSQATNAVGDLQNTVLNLGTHATKLSTSIQVAEEQWREFFPIKARESGTEEKLLSFFFCNLLTSIGPCAGTLFVSDLALYFVSDQELEFEMQNEDTDESQYRVNVPFNCVKGMAPRTSPKNETERFIHVVTADGFDFWFSGFLNYDSAFAHLLSALHGAGRETDSLLRNEESP